MKKFLFLAVFAVSAIGTKAQYGEVNERLNRLEEKKGINQNLKEIDISNKKFVLLQDFDDHTERMFITVNGNQATYAEVFDDKSSGQISSNVFTGDVLRTNNNMLSFRFDTLEGKKVSLPVVKNLLMTKQKSTLYLIDINTKERWIDEASVGNK